MKGGVYKIVNIINSFTYFGSCGKQGFKSRWRIHTSDLKTNTHHSWILQRDWIKYGGSNFAFVIIKECSIIEAKKLEQILISKQGVGIKNKSYNILDRVDRAYLPKSVIKKIKKAHRNPNLIIKTNTSGFKGVCPYKNKWKASIFRYGHSYHIGYYLSKEEANIAYKKINKLNDKQFYIWWNKEYNKNRKDYKYILRGDKCPYTKIKDKDIPKIKKWYKIGKYSQVELGRMFKVHPGQICHIIHNNRRGNKKGGQ